MKKERKNNRIVLTPHLLSSVSFLINNIKRIFSNKLLLKRCGVGCLIFACLIFINIPLVRADLGSYIQTQDQIETARAEKQSAWEKALDKIKTALKKAGTHALWQTTRTMLNTLAYDAATYISTGDKGQAPMFEVENFGEFLTKAGDQAAGHFLESIGDEWNFNLCEPDFALKLKIGLGLREQVRPSGPDCTFTEMRENWQEELSDPDFLPKFQDMFNPTSNDLGIALSLQTGFMEDIAYEKDIANLQRTENLGWKDDTDAISGDRESAPGTAKSSLWFSWQSLYPQAQNSYGDLAVDAANVFLNRLAILEFEKLLKKIAGDYEEEEIYIPEIGDEEAGPATGGVASAERRFSRLLEPNFSVRGDYEILTELSVCIDPTKAGPTNCVINDKFREAIAGKLTVEQALEDRYLSEEGVFGFKASGLEPDFNEGFPYRSMPILRKFRIIPVGWELAAQYIKDHADVGTCNLGDLVSCYSDSDDYSYDSGSCSQGTWCQGLVDPGWVLKAPLNYCKREGPGPEIVSEIVVGSGENSSLSIARDDNYCADEQSCIKENNDGSCQLYGYCTGERRKWKFSGEACDPQYNTCQTFRNRDGSTVSYLENTLDYGSCSIDNIGCQAYCADYDYSNSVFSCTNDTGNKLYFDKDVEECDQENEGCNEMIRTKPGLGTNLLTNSSFEDDLDSSIWSGNGTQVEEGFNGSKALELSSSLSKTISVGPSDYEIGGENYTLSFYAKDCSVDDEFALGDVSVNGDWQALTSGDNWQFYKANHTYNAGAAGYQVDFTIDSSSCIIDAIKLEHGDTATVYSDYRENSLIYEKLLPDYLESECYYDPGDGFMEMKDEAPAECENFARACTKEEVGCELYTSVTDNFSVPVKAVSQDYCPSECVSYDTYIQLDTSFETSQVNYFIPASGQSCSAEAAGCDEFTNLDKIELGGEAREYYSYLRRCIKPADLVANCAEFYTWEGSDEAGYQLRVFSLQLDDDEPTYNNDPDVTEDDQSYCNETIYNLPAIDPSYNPDCRQFYNSQGGISYHLYTRTISCSDYCHPYRKTENNIDQEITTQAGCGSGSLCSSADGEEKCWDDNYGEAGACYHCKNLGKWNSQHQACIYYATPEEGVSCSASQNGCREYSGNIGNNMRTVLINDFEGSKQGWGKVSGADITSIELTSEALTVGGESLYISGGSYSASTTIDHLVAKDKSYVLSFIAKPITASQINSIKLVNNSGEEADFATITFGNGWQFYKVNLAKLDHEISNSESLVFQVDGSFYIDNIKLIEIIDRYFLIKDSWLTPDSCNQDSNNNPYPLYMLGCDQYKDRDNAIHNLRSFNQLCQESAVGCEMMIRTNNYSDYNAQTFNAGDASETVITADSFAYFVYDKDKDCNSNDQGCQLLGKSHQYESEVIYENVYLLNDPDDYNTILCSEAEVGCEEWATAEGTSYFKDTGDMVCQWRQQSGAGASSWGWFKWPVARCDDNGNGVIDLETTICKTDSDCTEDISCISDLNDYPCRVDYFKTIGYGGSGNIIYQPTRDAQGNYWAGLCLADQSGCSEYIDPVSKFSNNVIFNPDYSDIDRDTNAGDGWDTADNSQAVEIKPYTLYVLRGSGASIEDYSGIYRLTENNILELVTSDSLSVGGSNSVIFYSDNNTSCTVKGGGVGKTIELRKAVVDYQLNQDVDKTSCNGVVDFDEGCILFNERVQAGSGSYASLSMNAALTMDGEVPNLTSPYDANALVKVTPDRVCDSWLACRSYIKNEDGNNVCFDIDLCNSVDENGNCDNFVTTNRDNQIYPDNITVDVTNNMSGYARVGYGEYNSFKADYYPFSAMEQTGKRANLANGGFELAGDNDYPVGWIMASGSWEDYMFKIIGNPAETQDECLNPDCSAYVPEGNNYLKLGALYEAHSEIIEVVGSIDYLLTAYINTVNLRQGQSRIAIEQYSNSGTSLTEDVIIMHDSGQPWIFKLGNFTTRSNAAQIKIKLYAEPTGPESPTGYLYYDGLSIKPALYSRDNQYTPQTCRLYPNSDAKSCEYFDDSGIRQKGWFGYCLEHDRYPGSPDNCILWWPVDKVDGEGIEEGAGYDDRFPLYYCTARIPPQPVLSGNTTFADEEYRMWVNGAEVTGGWSGAGTIPDTSLVEGRNVIALYVNADSKKGDTGVNMSWQYFTMNADSTPSPVTINSSLDWKTATTSAYAIIPAGWEAVNFDDSSWVTPNKDGYLCVGSCGASKGKGIFRLTFNITPAYEACLRIAQVVTPVGQNKYWSGRMYAGTDYAIPGAGYDYFSDYMPFGSIVYPEPSSNPYEWDSESDLDYNQPLVTQEPDTENPGLTEPYQARAGQIHSANTVKRIFAQSYGIWQWSGSNYTRDDAAGSWGPPTGQCSGNSRPACSGNDCYACPGTTCDWCAVAPGISSIKVNNVTGSNIQVAQNGFAILTFNSSVDSQQLPLVMFTVDWGDNEYTAVSGVEMRDRPNADNPHSMYHLYSYWDLKAKREVDQGPEEENTVFCGDADSQPTNFAAAASASGVTCPSERNCCVVKPRIKIKDNWGWCNAGKETFGGAIVNPTTISDCNQWAEFANWVVVTE